MSTTWPDSSEQEYEAYDGGEGYGDVGEDYGEESRAERRRRARIALARRRQAETQARARAGGPIQAGPGSAQQRTASAIRTLDLESKVAEDSLRSAIQEQNRRINKGIAGTERAIVGTTLVGLGMRAFDGPSNPWLSAALQVLPLWLLAPQRRGTGFQQNLLDPRVVGTAGGVGLALAGHFRDRFTGLSHQVTVQSPPTMTTGESDVFIADIRDRFGSRLNVPISWSSNKPDTVKIDPRTGEVTAGTPGVAVITLNVDHDPHDFRLRVEAPSSHTGEGQAVPAAPEGNPQGNEH